MKKCDSAFRVTDPEFVRARVKIEVFLLVNFCLCVPRGKDFNANFRRFRKAGSIAKGFHTRGRRPGHIGRSHAIRGRNSALSERAAAPH